MEVSGQLHSLAAVPLGKAAWYKLDMRLDGPQNQSLVTPREKICIELRREREWAI
jgi:hypothetical protein